MQGSDDLAREAWSAAPDLCSRLAHAAQFENARIAQDSIKSDVSTVFSIQKYVERRAFHLPAVIRPHLLYIAWDGV